MSLTDSGRCRLNSVNDITKRKIPWEMIFDAEISNLKSYISNEFLRAGRIKCTSKSNVISDVEVKFSFVCFFSIKLFFLLQLVNESIKKYTIEWKYVIWLVIKQTITNIEQIVTETYYQSWGKKKNSANIIIICSWCSNTMNSKIIFKINDF